MTPKYGYKMVLPEEYERVPLLGLRAWCAALRSGQYPQGSACMFDGVRYCCLGVLGRVEGMELDLKIAGPQDTLRGSVRQYGVLAGLGKLPHGVLIEVEALQRRSDVWLCTLVDDGDPLWTLAAANDKGLTFEQIADILEVVYCEDESTPK